MRADTSQLDAALAKSSGELGALGAAGAKSSSSLSQSFTKVGQTMSSVGQKMSTTGRHLTTSVTLPIAAIGVVATKSALDFNTAFAKIGALAGDIGTSMSDAEAHVKALSAATGQAPQDLADSLYFIASAGLKANKVMDTLDITAEAAATGMGSAADIGQTLTSVLNAYAGTGLDAAKSMNILTEAVKLGKAETSDFATGLGPIIGVAANAGVSLNELTGAIAQATNLGVPFARAVTGLRFTIQSLENPTDTAGTALKQFGIDATKLAGMVADPNVGLVGTLQYLYNTLASGGAEGRKAWAAITGGARSSIVAVDLVGKHQDQTNSIIKQMGVAAGDSATVFQDAYKKIQATPAFKFQQALAQLKVAAIDLGNILIPILINDIVPAIKSAVEWFANLSDGTKSLIVKLAIAAAAGGPILMFVGTLLKIGGAASQAIGWLGKLGSAAAGLNLGGGAGGLAELVGGGAAGWAAIATGIGTVGAAIGGVVAAAGGLMYAKNLVETFSTSAGDLANQFGVTEQQAKDVQQQIGRGASEWNLFGSGADKAKEALARYNAVVQEATKAGIPASVIQLKLNAAWKDAVHQIGGLTGSLPDFQRVLEESLGLAKTTDEVKQLTTAVEHLASLPITGNIVETPSGGQKFVPDLGPQNAALARLIAVMRTARENGANLGEALGPELASSLAKGTISIQQWRDAFAAVGAKIPYAASQAQGFQQSLLTTTKLTTDQKDQLNALFTSYDELGIHLDPGIAAFTHAGIAAGDFNGVMNVMSNDIKGKVLSTFSDLKGSLDKTSASQIQAALHAHDYVKAAVLEAQAQQDAAKAAHFHATAIIGDTKASKDQVAQITKLTGELPKNTKNLSDNVRNLIEQATKADTSKEKIALLQKALDKVKGNYDANVNVKVADSQTKLNELYAGLKAAGVHIRGWVLDAAKGLAASDDFKGAIGQLASSLTKSSLESALKGLGGSISNNTRKSIEGKIEAHKYTAALLEIARAATKAQNAQKDQTDNLRNVTSAVLTNHDAFNALANSFINYSKLSTNQTSTVEHLTNKLYDEGGALKDNQVKALQAAIATGHFGKAQDILEHALDGVRKGADQNAESYKRVNGALAQSSTLSAKNAKAIQDETKALYDSGQKLSAHEAALLANAVAAANFKKAEDILSDASKTWTQRILGNSDATKAQTDAIKALAGQLPDNTSKLKDNVQSLIDQAKNADSAKEKIKLLTQALEDMHGQYDFTVDANTQPAEAQLQKLINDARQKYGMGVSALIPQRHEGGMVGDDGKLPMSTGLKPNERLIVALNDEMVMNPKATRKFRGELERMNRFHDGGIVGADLAGPVKDLTAGLSHMLPQTVNLEFTPETLKAIKDALVPQIPKGGGGAWGGYENGRIPLSALTPIGNGKYLAPFAATAFDAMEASYGHNIDVVSAYRSYEEQARIYNSGVRPAAPPGHSMHGWGEAVDVAGGAAGWLPSHSRAFNWYRGVSFGDPNHYSYGYSADQGAFFKKRTDVSMMPGEVALAPDSMQSVRALSKAMGQAARLHDGGAVAPSGALVESGRNQNQNGDGFHLGKYRQLLDLIGTHHIDRILEKVKKLYRSEDQFPKDYVTGTLRRANLHQLHKVAPNRDDIADFVKHLAENVDAHQGGGQGGHDSGGDGLHLGKYRHLLNIIDARHIKAKVAHVKELYGEQHNFPTKYVLGTLGKADMRDVHKVAPNVNSKRAFVQKLAELARGHGGGGGGGGGGNGHGGGAGGIGGGLFGKVFGDFDKTLGMAATQQLADQFVGKLKDEYGDTHALNIGQITKVVDAMFQQVPAENYLNALETRWENAVGGKTVKLADKSGRSYAVTQAILKLLGAHQGTGGGAGGGTGRSGGGDQGALAYHLGPLSKLLKELKVNHPQSVIDNVKKRYEPHHQFPFDWLGNILSGASLKDIHKVDAKAKSLKDFMQDLANGIDHSPHGGNSGGGGGHGGGGGNGGGHGGGGHGGSRIDQLIRDHKHWDRASASQSHQLARWMLDRNVNGLKSPSAFHDLSYIIARESNWRWNAGSPPHAYGIPQSLPGNKMRTSGADWLTNSQTQEDWMFKYIKGRYHTMSQALQHKKATGWYGSGLDRVFTQPTTIGVGERGPEHVQVTPLGKSSNDLKIQLRVDRKRFNRDMDLDYVVSGR